MSENSVQESKKQSLLIVAGDYMLLITFAFFAVQFSFLCMQLIFGITSFATIVALGFGTTLSFILLKDHSSDNHKKIGLIVFKASVALFLMSLLTHLSISLIHKIGEDHTGVGTLMHLSLLTNILIGIMAFSHFKKEENVDLYNKIKEESFWSRFKKGNSDAGKQPGDVKLCTSAEDGKDVLWRFKDRFLHMLVLGPTGSGKTSQILMPLINQDMQNKEAGITVIEPKGDFAEQVYAMAEHYGRKAIYFNPTLPDCPYFNPLYGKEEDVVENMATTFKMLNTDSPQFFLDMNETLIRNSIKVLKRLYGNKANFIELFRLIHNSAGMGRKMVSEFTRISTDSPEIEKENSDIAAWFLNDYFNEKSKVYEHCSGLRSQVAKITSNKHLRRVLNPVDGENDLDFDKHLEEGGVIAISTAQGDLRDLGKFLGYFVILQFQSSVFKRPGNENTRRAHFLYIDEFQTYANSGFADMLTQGRSYRVASHLATQNRALIGMNSGKDGKNFVELVSTNARNIVIFPGANAQDAKYYSEQFGQIMQKTTQIGISRQKFNPLKGIKSTNYDTESIREVEKLEYRFTSSDIIYRPFGEVTYCLIENNSIQEPSVGKIEYIPRDLKEKLDEMVDKYNSEQKLKEDQMEPASKIELDLKPVMQEDIVISNNVIKKAESEDIRARNRDVVPANEDYRDSYVLNNKSRNLGERLISESIFSEEEDVEEEVFNSVDMDLDDKAIEDLMSNDVDDF